MIPIKWPSAKFENAQQLLNAQDRVAAAARNTADKQLAFENATRRYEVELEPKRLTLRFSKSIKLM